MPVETPALAEIRDRLESAKPISWIEAMVASINWRRLISSIPTLGMPDPLPREALIRSGIAAAGPWAENASGPKLRAGSGAAHTGFFILDDQSNKNMGT